MHHYPHLTCEQALRGTLMAGWEKEGELATTSLEFKFHLQFPCGSLLTKVSDFHQSARSGNERECEQTLKNTCQCNDVITNVISINQHFALTFPMQIFKFQRRSCKPSFLFPPRRQSALESLLVGYTQHLDSASDWLKICFVQSEDLHVPDLSSYASSI